MYADKDSRGLVSVFEMDRPEWSALRGACQMAVQLWEVQLMEFAGLAPMQMQTWEIQRKCHLEQCIGIARKMIFEIDQANERVDDDLCQKGFEAFLQNDKKSGEAIDIFNL